MNASLSDRANAGLPICNILFASELFADLPAAAYFGLRDVENKPHRKASRAAMIRLPFNVSELKVNVSWHITYMAAPPAALPIITPRLILLSFECDAAADAAAFEVEAALVLVVLVTGCLLDVAVEDTAEVVGGAELDRAMPS